MTASTAGDCIPRLIVCHWWTPHFLAQIVAPGACAAEGGIHVRSLVVPPSRCRSDEGPSWQGRAQISVPFGPSALLTGMESQAPRKRRNCTMKLDPSGRDRPAAECVVDVLPSHSAHVRPNVVAASPCAGSCPMRPTMRLAPHPYRGPKPLSSWQNLLLRSDKAPASP